MDRESEKGSIKELFQGMIPVAVAILQGIILSTSPLMIQIVNDKKLTISSNITIIPKHLTDYETTADITWEEKMEDKLKQFNRSGAKVTVHNALKPGEIVHILSLQNGKKYYVLDRV